VTRSIGRVHRIGRLAVAGAAVLAVGLASGCSSGQLAATSRIVPAVPGGSVTVKVPDPNNANGAVLVQNATLDFAPGYPAGSSAPLSVRIINQTNSPVTVMPGSATLQAPDTFDPGNAKSVGTLAWASSTSPNGSGPSIAPPSPSAPASPSSSDSTNPSPGASQTPAAPPAPVLRDLKVVPAGLLILTSASDQYLAITGLTQPLSPGDIVNVTLNFAVNGKSYVASFAVPIAPPEGPVNRSPIAGAPSGS
jgi:hypothetical protein